MSNKNDIVYTPERVARAIISHFNPTGAVLDPCKGGGAFYNNLPEHCAKEWCEIEQGFDFFKYRGRVSWIISNPPFSIYDAFLTKAFEVANDVVFLIPLYKVYKSQRQQREIDAYGGLKQVLIIGSGSVVGFNFGFLCGCVHYQRHYKGCTETVWLNLENENNQGNLLTNRTE